MKNRLTKILILSLIFILLFGTVSAFGYESYDTYTYSIDGLALKSPTAYTASVTMTSFDMKLVTSKFGGLSLNQAADVTADKDGNVYIADKGNNRVVVLDQGYHATAVISSYVDEYRNEQTLKAPEGIFVTNKKDNADGSNSYVYVCDTGNRRVVVFDKDNGYKYVKTIKCPETPLLKETDFVPNAVAVDIYGRIFVVSKIVNEGVIVLSKEGDFTGFIGAQKVTYNLMQMIWRRFQTQEQRDAAIKNVSVSYNNVTVDMDGFVYATSDKIDKTKQLDAIKSKTPDYSPVKKLNSTGVEIMKRNGFFDPGGEVDVFYADDVSQITDIALGPEGSWTILDNTRKSGATTKIRFFTYDQSGNLLFAFGERGEQLGQGESIVAITYQQVDGVNYLLALDSTSTGYKLVVYSPTEYCDTIINALRNENNHDYSESIECWQDVLTRNNNFDLAYIGIGKALFNQGKYEEAQEVLEKAYETDYASKAFAEMRKGVIGKNILWVVLAVIVVLVLFFKLLGYAKKKNKATSLKVGRKTYFEELLYVFHLVFHPFDGFWDLKHEKRGSVRAASTILGITIISMFYQSIGKGYLFNPRGTYSTIFFAIISIAVPVILFVVSNWCLTTLFDGEGSFKDIYIATCYSLAPLPLFVIVSTVLTNVLTATESSIVTLLVAIGYVWVGILLFFGMVVTHDYSIGKNIITILGTIVAMVVIMFVAILFSSLVVKMVSFVISLITEIAGRV